MKKLFLTLAATALCTTAFAGTRVLYQQNFDQAVNAEATGWSYGGGSMTIASDEYGKFLELALGQNNGRSGQCTWGTEIYQDADGNLMTPRASTTCRLTSPSRQCQTTSTTVKSPFSPTTLPKQTKLIVLLGLQVTQVRGTTSSSICLR